MHRVKRNHAYTHEIRLNSCALQRVHIHNPSVRTGKHAFVDQRSPVDIEGINSHQRLAYATGTFPRVLRGCWRSVCVWCHNIEGEEHLVGKRQTAKRRQICLTLRFSNTLWFLSGSGPSDAFLSVLTPACLKRGGGGCQAVSPPNQRIHQHTLMHRHAHTHTHTLTRSQPYTFRRTHFQACTHMCPHA